MSRSDCVTDTLVIDATVVRIRKLIARIRPRDRTLVAFDGVAPLGKMKQQRERRWKNTLSSESVPIWDTCKITPGTEFMAVLGRRARNELSDCAEVSCSSEPGEGEHKIFHDIGQHSYSRIAVYGLDADLIMLSLLHSGACKSFLLFRETPDFIASIDSSLSPDEDYYIDITKLTPKLLSTVRKRSSKKSLIEDYVVACFLLGNDFPATLPWLVPTLWWYGACAERTEGNLAVRKETGTHWRNKLACAAGVA